MRRESMLVQASHLERIRDGHELANMLHEALYDAMRQHAAVFDGQLAASLIVNMKTTLGEECDTATTKAGEAYYLVPIPAQPEPKVAA